ncbi:hypothetical protein [Halospeciosus flavus]|uniref:Uncharacterized protein n=1 Tax=Halospeciosus flavus TaxID=3032283 RepID=A0ABD5YWN6_9EURY|nr:hypothetical protein [Halospeciosus flavus]
MAGFDLSSGSGSNQFLFDVKEALNTSDRQKLVKCLAEYKVVPVKNQWRKSEFGQSVGNFERRGPKVGGNNHAFGQKTRQSVLSLLGIDEEEDVEPVREEIKSHPNWGDSC